MSAWTVARLLKIAGYRLQAPVKTREGRQHPDRDGLFRYLAEGAPVVSLDTKKELVGDFANKGRESAYRALKDLRGAARAIQTSFRRHLLSAEPVGEVVSRRVV